MRDESQACCITYLSVGAGHTSDEHGERQQSVQEMANGVQEAEHRSGSSAQSRSTSYSSNMDIESEISFPVSSH